MSWSLVQNFTDPDAFQAAFRYMRAKSFITGRGNFRANFTTIQLDRLSLQGAEETLPRTAYSGLDPRKFAIGFATHPRQQLYSMASKWCLARSSCCAQHPKGIFVTIQLADGAPLLSHMRMLRLPARP